MQTLIYDGSFAGWLCAVFDVYYYKFTDVEVCAAQQFQGTVFGDTHTVTTVKEHSRRVWKGLEKKLSAGGVQNIYKTFLSHLPGIDTTLLRYTQYVLDSPHLVETDYSHPAVITVLQTAKKVAKEKHRMEAFVRFQQTGDGLYYAVIEPDYNVLPLLHSHFKKRYADQRWMIYDARRRYGIYYDLQSVTEVQIDFKEEINRGKDISAVYDEQETLYQTLWQQYFKSTNIPARKNTKLHIQQMPARYWKYLPEKRTAFGN